MHDAQTATAQGNRQERANSLNKQRQGQFTAETRTNQFTEAGTEAQQADTPIH